MSDISFENITEDSILSIKIQPSEYDIFNTVNVRVIPNAFDETKIAAILLDESFNPTTTINEFSNDTEARSFFNNNSSNFYTLRYGRQYSGTSVQNGVYAGCVAIKNLIIKGGINTIGQGAFNQASNLTTIVFPSVFNAINTGAFAETKVERIVLPNGLEELSMGVFSNCSYLTEIVLPTTLTTLGENCLSGTSITSIIIPESVINIHNEAFDSCPFLTEINVQKEEDSIVGAPWGAENATVIWNN